MHAHALAYGQEHSALALRQTSKTKALADAEISASDAAPMAQCPDQGKQRSGSWIQCWGRTVVQRPVAATAARGCCLGRGRRRACGAFCGGLRARVCGGSSHAALGRDVRQPHADSPRKVSHCCLFPNPTQQPRRGTIAQSAIKAPACKAHIQMHTHIHGTAVSAQGSVECSGGGTRRSVNGSSCEGEPRWRLGWGWHPVAGPGTSGKLQVSRCLVWI